MALTDYREDLVENVFNFILRHAPRYGKTCATRYETQRTTVVSSPENVRTETGL